MVLWRVTLQMSFCCGTSCSACSLLSSALPSLRLLAPTASAAPPLRPQIHACLHTFHTFPEVTRYVGPSTSD